MRFLRRKPRIKEKSALAFPKDPKKLKTFQYHLMLSYGGNHLTSVKMEMKSTDRETAKRELMAILKFRIVNMKEVKSKSKK